MKVEIELPDFKGYKYIGFQPVTDGDYVMDGDRSRLIKWDLPINDYYYFIFRLVERLDEKK